MIQTKYFKIGRIIGIMIIFSLLISMIPPAFAGSSILPWHLVDSGKHLDWNGSTQFQSEFNSSVNTWNNHKSGVIRKDSLVYICDVRISDVYIENGDFVGSTTPGTLLSPAGTIRFNTWHMNGWDSEYYQNVCTHELGHALGLAHNEIGDVMYYQVTARYQLSDNDKLSYNASYARY